MKRLTTITCCFLVLFAGATASWASCLRPSLAKNDHHRASVAPAAHDHEPGGDHDHSGNHGIHCNFLDEFVAVTSFYANLEKRAELVSTVLPADFNYGHSGGRANRSRSSPPGSDHLATIPQYLLISTLRL